MRTKQKHENHHDVKHSGSQVTASKSAVGPRGKALDPNDHVRASSRRVKHFQRHARPDGAVKWIHISALQRLPELGDTPMQRDLRNTPNDNLAHKLFKHSIQTLGADVVHVHLQLQVVLTPSDTMHAFSVAIADGFKPVIMQSFLCPINVRCMYSASVAS